MKAIPVKNVKSVLVDLGLSRMSGNGTGHEVWKTPAGKRCNPVMRHKDMNIASLYALGLQLEGIGCCTRQFFMHSATQGKPLTN